MCYQLTRHAAFCFLDRRHIPRCCRHRLHTVSRSNSCAVGQPTRHRLKYLHRCRADVQQCGAGLPNTASPSQSDDCRTAAHLPLAAEPGVRQRREDLGSLGRHRRLTHVPGTLVRARRSGLRILRRVEEEGVRVGAVGGRAPASTSWRVSGNTYAIAVGRHPLL